MHMIIIAFFCIQYIVPYDSPLTQQIEYLRARQLIDLPMTKPYELHWLMPHIDRLLITDYPLTKSDRRVLSLLSPLITKKESFSFLIHIGGMYEHDPELYGGFIDYRAGGTIVKNIRFSHAMRFNRTSKVDSLGPKPWRDFQVYMTEGSIDIDIKSVQLFFGRKNHLFGHGDESSLLLSLDRQGYDGFGLYIPSKYFEFHNIFAVINAQDARFLTIHRLGLRLQNVLTIGFSEALLFAHTLEPLYLNFLLPYYLTQWGTYRDDNVLWLLDARIRAFGSMFYGELLIDDYMFEDDSFPNKLGWKFGIKGSALQHVLYSASYTFVDKWVYTQRQSINVYERNGYPLGFPLGNDVDQTRISISYTNVIPVNPMIDITYIRKGEGSIFLPYEEESGNWNPPFPSGVVEHTLDMRLGIYYAIKNNIHIYADIGQVRYQNYGHVTGDDRNDLVFSTSLWIVY